MKFGPLCIFGGDALVSWQWKWSLTWSWIITLRWHRRTHKLGFYRVGKAGDWRMGGWNNWIFDFCFQRQPTIVRDWPFSPRNRP